MKYYLFAGAFSAAVIVFYLARFPELVSMTTSNPMHALMAGAGLLAASTLHIIPPSTGGLTVRRLGLVFLVLFQLKQEMDTNLEQRLDNRIDLGKVIAVVTGANSGTGYAISQLLLERNATVVMTCRSLIKCQHAAREIEADVHRNTPPDGHGSVINGRLEVMVLDLADLGSVKSFVNEFKAKHNHLDILVNNGGLIPKVGERTAQGLESSFGAMHIGHFALTKWLSPLLTMPVDRKASNHPSLEAARVVNIGSQAYMSGKFHDSLLQQSGVGDLHGELTDNCGMTGPGGLLPCCPLLACPFTNGYARAKLANLLHAQELQLQYGES
jgi:NAD(P)-dependent dehydrogenase (short-subunit alcohol dehydrogenase family)